LFGAQSQDELVGRPLLDLGHPEDREPVTGRIRVVAGGGTMPRREVRMLRLDGQAILTEGTAALVDLQGRPAILAIVRDIGERRRLEARLAQAQKMEAIGLLAGGVAHDFNNLLTIIIGHSENLLAQFGPDTPARVSAAEIKAAGDRAAVLTRRLLAFSRRQPVQLKVVDLNGVIAGMESMLRRLLGEHILLETSPCPDLWLVKADPCQLEQVVMNLVINARDAMSNSGRIRIETRNLAAENGGLWRKLALPPGEHVLMAVHDSGKGIDPNILPNIFEPFFTTKEHGSGLGLSTVYGIVRQSGGEVRVESRPREGASFYVCLPRASA
jgi:hypothetical protein